MKLVRLEKLSMLILLIGILFNYQCLFATSSIVQLNITNRSEQPLTGILLTDIMNVKWQCYMPQKCLMKNAGAKAGTGEAKYLKINPRSTKEYYTKFVYDLDFYPKCLHSIKFGLNGKGPTPYLNIVLYGNLDDIKPEINIIINKDLTITIVKGNEHTFSDYVSTETTKKFDGLEWYNTFKKLPSM